MKHFEIWLKFNRNGRKCVFAMKVTAANKAEAQNIAPGLFGLENKNATVMESRNHG